MATLTSLPQEIQNHIANMIRPQGNPFQEKAPNVAHLKTTCKVCNNIPLIKLQSLKKEINDFKMLNKKCGEWLWRATGPWAEKINREYGSTQGVRIGFIEQCINGKYKMVRGIFLDITLNDLIRGWRNVPSCFFSAAYAALATVKSIEVPTELRVRLLAKIFNERITKK